MLVAWIDLKRVGTRGSEAEKHALASRIFEVWRPLFTHLADKEYTYFLPFPVDISPAVSLASFVVDDDGADRGFFAMRIHEGTYAGRAVAQLTFQIGLQAEVRGRARLAPRVFLEVLRYRLRHPVRRFFFVDAPMNAASYHRLNKGVFELYPRPGRPIPERLWPLVEDVAVRMGWEALPGCPREARQVNRTLTQEGRADARRASPEYEDIAAWFARQTGNLAGSGVLSVAPVTFRNIALSAAKELSRH